MLQWYAWGGQRQEGRISSLDDTWADTTTPYQQREAIWRHDRGEDHRRRSVALLALER